MAVHELEHPLGKDLETVHTAFSIGLVTDKLLETAPHIKVNYEDPIGSGVGVGTLRIADWATENMTAIYFPIAVDPANTTWQVFCEDGIAPVRQRVFTRDILGRGFPITLGGTEIISPYVQLDILDEGLALTLDDKGEQAIGFGKFEGEVYDIMDRMVRHYSSIRPLLELAQAA